MRRVLVGVDGSQASIGALAWAADIARRTGWELSAARAFDPGEAELPPDRYEELRVEQRVELVEWCTQISQPALVVEHLVVGDGSPPDALLAAAGDGGADLVVVGGRGAGGFAQLHLGSVAHHLAHHTNLPLAIVPDGAPVGTGHLVVGVDGSKESAAAVRVSAELSAGLGVPVTAVYAFEPFFEWVPADDPASWHQRAADEVRHWAAPISERGSAVEVVVERDIHPVAAIERALAADRDAVAVVGTRGAGGFTGLRLGRTPLQLVHHTGHVVVLVPLS